MLEVYSAEWCQPCKQLKKLLDTNNIEYKVIDIDKDPETSRIRGIRGIPTLIEPTSGERLVGSVTKEQVTVLLARAQ